MRTLRLEARRGVKVNVLHPAEDPAETCARLLRCCSPDPDCPDGQLIAADGSTRRLATGRGVALAGELGPESIAGALPQITSLEDPHWVDQPIAALGLMTLPINLASYRERLREAYPADATGRTLYPFRRVFMVARR